MKRYDMYNPCSYVKKDEDEVSKPKKQATIESDDLDDLGDDEGFGSDDGLNDDLDDDLDEIEEEAPAPAPAKRKHTKPTVQVTNFDDEEEDDTKPEPKIDKPMWTTNEKREKKAAEKGEVYQPNSPQWLKPPSRMSTGDWVITLILMMIPVINIICIFIWSFFSDSVAEEKRHYARANLILVGVFTIALLVALLTFGKFELPVGQIKNAVSNVTEDVKGGAQDELDDASSEYEDYFTTQ